MNALNKKVNPMVNAALLNSFPTSVEVAGGISMSTGFTGPVTISNDYITLPLDGTVFETEKGYHRSSESKPMPASTASKDDLIGYASDYALETFSNAFNAKAIEYTSSILWHTPVTLKLNKSVKLSFEKGVFVMNIKPTINVNGWFDFDSSVTLKVSPQLHEGSTRSICSVKPELEVIKMQESYITY